MRRSYTQILTLTILLAFITLEVTAQTVDSTKGYRHFSGSMGLTNNGIALVPSFSLGKPAAILTFSAGTDQFAFEPDIRYTLDFKRGGMALFFRYRPKMKGRFQFAAGFNPAYNFFTKNITENGETREIIQAQRFVGTELVPSYIINKHLAVGMYYLYGRGLQKDGPVNLHFVTLNLNLTNLRISNNLLFQVMPQVYYLKQDAADGFYFTATGGFVHKKIPVSIFSTINAEIRSNVAGSKPFDWNISVLYSFNKLYAKLKH